jgi:protoporphyrinogen oxidase
MSVRVAVIGAGLTGLTAAHALGKRGIGCDVYERWPGLGGQAATLDVGGGVLLERYYHHLFTSDRHIAALYRELGMPDAIEWLPSSLGVLRGSTTYAFTTPLDLLRFSPLRLRTRARMAAAVGRLLLGSSDVSSYEAMTAREWVVRSIGQDGWDTLWGPLLSNKFGDRAGEVSMAWLWSRLTARRRGNGREAAGEVLGYPRGSFEPLFTALVAAIECQGGRVLTDRPAARLAHDAEGFQLRAGAPESFRAGHDPSRFASPGEAERYDAVIATVGNSIFEGLLEPGLCDQLAPGYLERLRSVDYHAALCLTLELDRELMPCYWTSVVDRQVPFIGLIEQTKLVPAERYGGRRFVYVANYVGQDDPMLAMSADELLTHYEPGLRQAHPGFSRGWVRNVWLHREPHAQHIVTVGYRQRMPPLATGVPGLILANTTQVYPEDRGTNYAVRLGEEAAAAVSERS